MRRKKRRKSNKEFRTLSIRRVTITLEDIVQSWNPVFEVLYGSPDKIIDRVPTKLSIRDISDAYLRSSRRKDSPLPVFYLLFSLITKKLEDHVIIALKKEKDFRGSNNLVISLAKKLYSSEKNRKLYNYVVLGELTRVVLLEYPFLKQEHIIWPFLDFKKNKRDLKKAFELILDYSKKIDLDNIIEKLDEQGVPSSPFKIAFRYNGEKLIFHSRLLLVLKVISFLVSEEYLGVEEFIRWAPTLDKIYRETGSNNPLVYEEVLFRIARRKRRRRISLNTLYQISLLHGKLSFPFFPYYRRAEQILRHYSDNLDKLREYLSTHFRGRQCYLIRRDIQRLQRLSEDLKNYNIDEITRETWKYLKSIEDWDSEVEKIFRSSNRL